MKSAMRPIAFLGTGTMGLPMARHLARAGVALRAWNRTLDRARPLEAEGATVCEEPGDAAQDADIVITMLSDAAAVLDTAAPALDAASPAAVWLQMSTIGLEGTRRCIELADRVGARLVDAPVLGTRESWIVGLVNVLAETIALAQALDLDPQSFFDAIDDGPLDLPYGRMKGAAMLARSFDDATVRLALARKDADLVLAAASEDAAAGTAARYASRRPAAAA